MSDQDQTDNKNEEGSSAFALTKSEKKKLDLATAMTEKSAIESDSLGFMARQLVLATLPHRDPGNDLEAWIRTNGNYHLILQQGLTGEVIDGKPEKIGYPYGTIPRLLMAWVSSEAFRTKSPELMLGSTLTEFMADLGMKPTGGKNGTITRLRDQMKRLFSATISFTHNGVKDGAFQRKNLNIASETHLWWDPHRPDQGGLFPSKVILGREFFDEIIKYPVPIDMRALKYLRNSPMALDIYTWLTYRMSYLDRPLPLTWEGLQAQFGGEYSRSRKFREKFQENLKSVLQVYPEARVKTDDKKGITLLPSPPHVPKLKQK